MRKDEYINVSYAPVKRFIHRWENLKNHIRRWIIDSPFGEKEIVAEYSVASEKNVWTNSMPDFDSENKHHSVFG